MTYAVRMLEGEYVSTKIDVHCFLFDIDDVHILDHSKYVMIGYTSKVECFGSMSISSFGVVFSNIEVWFVRCMCRRIVFVPMRVFLYDDAFVVNVSIIVLSRHHGIALSITYKLGTTNRGLLGKRDPFHVSWFCCRWNSRITFAS
ncbi:hypothetical protein A8L59_15800 [Pseudomonas koreensis]|uniref:Uncharacterized protein n=1 Tax=Pseudomonas koreensis TaxID=198620 RepID=A0AAC9BTV2_9PSED|nr:hypothetical protein A8L59_15800 [Pseudomonas koreensis]